MLQWVNKSAVAAVIFLTALVAGSAMGQTVSPPIAEYRVKASGMFELRNDQDFPLAAILEVHGFSVSEQGQLQYNELDPRVNVELGANSFIIPPHQSHYVFYKAKSDQPSYWFTILSTLTKANPEKNQMRLNFVLPHVVYVYQKPKLKKDDVEVALRPVDDGSFTVDIQNHSGKLARVQTIEIHGFEKELQLGGVPIFPEKQRFVNFNAGRIRGKSEVKVVFEDGFTISVPVS